MNWKKIKVIKMEKNKLHKDISEKKRIMGVNIKKARMDAGLSQENLSKLIGYRRASISVIENGKTEVGSVTLWRMADVMGKPISYFYRGIEEKNNETQSVISVKDVLRLLAEYENVITVVLSCRGNKS